MKVKFDTFIVGVIVGLVAVTSALISLNADAAEMASTVKASPVKPEHSPKWPARIRYTHKCSKSVNNPTLVPVDRPLRRSTVSIETGRYYPGLKKRPAMNVIHLDNGKVVIQAVFIYKHERKTCTYRNNLWTVDKFK